ncbi:MAG: DnaA regulatory inactivator Hda, partial [Gammaproteobacteria bacterium]|nr:DnaA regulatory inactivator Hda [Gammaproteobacteria bacterium]
CQGAAVNQYLSAYLPFKQIVHCASDVLEGLENVDIVCVDDIQLIQHKKNWHEPVFDLINRLRAAGKFLLFASTLPPNEMIIELEDLRSRFNWGPVIKIRPLNDEQKRQALQLRAESRGFELPDNVANYILNNFERDMPGLFEKLEQLDKVSLQQQRRLTVPFVKQVFG